MADQPPSSQAAATYSFDTPKHLPERYGDNRLVLLARDPHWFFAYWEVTPERLDVVRRERVDERIDQAVWVLRVYDVTDGHSEGGNGSPFMDVEVQANANRWYVKVARSGRFYVAHLGLRLPDGKFIVLLVSNRIRLPLGHVSDKTDSQWMAVGYGDSETEKWNRLMEASGASQIGRGSVEIARTMAQRWEFLKSVFSGSWSSGASPSSGASLRPFYLPEEETK